MRVAFLLYEGMDLMDVAGPQEVLLTANRLLARRDEEPRFDLITCSPDGRQVQALGGMRIVPDHDVATVVARGSDLVVVPGAVDTVALTADTELLGQVLALSASTRRTASVCTGAFLLAAAGLLDGRSWTTHAEDLPVLAEHLPGGVRERVVDAGGVLTAGGVTAGIDLALHVVAQENGAELARLVARHLEYPWDRFGDPTGGRDPVVVERVIAADRSDLYRLLSTQPGVEAFLGVRCAIDTRVGGRYEYLFLDDEPPGLQGGEGCRILALQPDQLLVFTWNSPPGMPTRGTHTWVVVTLTSAPGGTLVRLVHTGHGEGPEWDENRRYFTSAWPRVLAALDRYAARPGPA